MKILELGSGQGEVMAQLCLMGHDVEAIDENPGFFGGKKMNVYEIDKFFKEKFDMVLLQMPLGFDIKEIVKKVSSVLSKGGVFYVLTEKNEIVDDLKNTWKGKIEYGIRDDVPLSYLAQTIVTTNVICELVGVQCLAS